MIKKGLAGVPRGVAPMAAASLIWGVGEGLFIFFLPLSLQYWQADTGQVGGVLSLIGVMMAGAQVPAGYLADRLGARRLIMAATLLGVAAALVMAAADSLAMFTAGLLAYSMTSLISAPLNSYLTGLRGSWSAQRAMTFVSGSLVMGQVAGPLLGGAIAASAGLPVIFRYSCGLFVLSSLVTGLTLARLPARPEAHPAGPRPAGPLSDPRFLGLLAIVLFTIVGMSTPQQLTSMYLENVHQLSIEQIGLLGTVASLGTVAIMAALGGLGARAGMLAGLGLVSGFTLLMWQGQGLAAFALGYALVGGNRLYRAMALAEARTLVPGGSLGLAYGVLETGNAVAVILAPLAASWLYQLRPEAVFMASLGAQAVMLALNTLFLRAPHPPAPAPGGAGEKI